MALVAKVNSDTTLWINWRRSVAIVVIAAVPVVVSSDVGRGVGSGVTVVIRGPVIRIHPHRRSNAIAIIAVTVSTPVISVVVVMWPVVRILRLCATNCH